MCSVQRAWRQLAAWASLCIFNPADAVPKTLTSNSHDQFQSVSMTKCADVSNKTRVQPFSLDTNQNSKFFIANYLWELMEPDWWVLASQHWCYSKIRNGHHRNQGQKHPSWTVQHGQSVHFKWHANDSWVCPAVLYTYEWKFIRCYYFITENAFSLKYRMHLSVFTQFDVFKGEHSFLCLIQV